MSTYGEYIGIPFAEKGRSQKGADCWGLVKLVYSRQMGINDLPDFAEQYQHTRDKVNIPLLVDEEKQHWQPVASPQEGDVVVFNLAGIPIHVGVMIDPGRFLHVVRGTNACIEKISSPVWANRIAGFYRYEP